MSLLLYSISVDKGKRVWNLCYHSTKYPVTTYTRTGVQCEVSNECLHHGQECCRNPSHIGDPNANSTMIDENDFDMSRNDASSHNPRSPLQNSAMKKDSSDHVSFEKASFVVTSHYTPTNFSINSAMKDNSVRLTPVFEHNSDDNSVGHMSHIPRKPPTPSTYTIPSCVNNSFGTEHNTGVDLFGMIKLKDNDVCYTSGSIEWVGRKRSYPINSGFKIINESLRQGNEPCLKRVRRLDNTFTIGDDKIKECDCANVLPTVNAIVDHLNALHEAVDLVDLRLNNIEDNVDKN